jgi:hypothetical protein
MQMRIRIWDIRFAFVSDNIVFISEFELKCEIMQIHPYDATFWATIFNCCLSWQQLMLVFSNHFHIDFSNMFSNRHSVLARMQNQIAQVALDNCYVNKFISLNSTTIYPKSSQLWSIEAPPLFFHQVTWSSNKSTPGLNFHEWYDSLHSFIWTYWFINQNLAYTSPLLIHQHQVLYSRFSTSMVHWTWGL